MNFCNRLNRYNVEPSDREPVGGAARFVTLIKNIKSAAAASGKPDPIVIFSGDAFNPSLLSTVTKGKHMVPCLNNIKVDGKLISFDGSPGSCFNSLFSCVHWQPRP